LILEQTINERKEVDISVTKTREGITDMIDQGEDVMISTMVKLAFSPTEEGLIHKSYLDDIIETVNVEMGGAAGGRYGNRYNCKHKSLSC
jgi:hypothetical protein